MLSNLCSGFFDNVDDLSWMFQVSGVVFISGDVHFCEISRFDCAPVGYPLYDMTSSGITQAVEELTNPVVAFVIRFAAWFVPNTMRVYNSLCRYKSCVYGTKHDHGPPFCSLYFLLDVNCNDS